MNDALLDYARLDALLPEARARFASADPFPHLVLDDFLPAPVAESALRAEPQQLIGARDVLRGCELAV